MNSNSKKILVVAPYFYPKIGGMENYAYNIARLFNIEEKYSVVVLTSNHKSGSYLEEEIEGMKIYRLPISFKFSNTPINLSWIKMVRRIIREEKPDIIHMHAPVPFLSDLVAFLAERNSRLVLTYHSGSMKKGKFPVDILIWLYEKIFLPLLFRRVDRVVAVSGSFLDRNWGVSLSDKTSLISPGVDLSRFSPAPFSAGKIVTFVGRIEKNSEWKGIEYLLRAMTLVLEKHPDARLEIIGGGDDVVHYKELAVRLGIDGKTRFFGFQTDQELLEAYKRSSVVVLPSFSSAESFGMVLLEGMASGRAVIGSRIGGIPYLIEDGKNGLLATPRDHKSLSEKICMVLEDRGLSERLARGGIETAKKSSWANRMKEYEKLFLSFGKNDFTIAHVVPYYPPHVGGMEVVAKRVSLGLAKEGDRVEVITSNIGSDGHEEKLRNYKLRRLRSFEIAHTPIMPSLPLQILLLSRRSLVHIHVAQALIPEITWLFAKIRKFPVFMHMHLDVVPSGPLGFLLPVYKKYVLGFVLRNSDVIFVLSAAQKDMFAKKYDIKLEKIKVVPNAVAEEFFYDEKKNFSSDKLRILFVGRLAIQKRLDVMLKTMSILDFPFELTLVGDGEDREELENMARDLGLKNIIFVGRKTGKELVEYYRAADVFMMTSEKEGMPLAILEAMASRLPVIGSDVIGITEMIEGVGILAQAESTHDFADKLRDLWKNRELLSELSEKSHEKAKEYSWQRMISTLKKTYEDFEA